MRNPSGPAAHRRLRVSRRHRWISIVGSALSDGGPGSDTSIRTCSAFIMAALDAGVPLRDVQLAARYEDPRTTTIYDRRRANFDRHAAYVVVAFVAVS